MTHADVESTISRLKAWMRARQGNDDWSVVLNDLEALRQHDEARAAAIERLKAALLAAASHHTEEATEENKSAHCHPWLVIYHSERARVLRGVVEGGR